MAMNHNDFNNNQTSDKSVNALDFLKKHSVVVVDSGNLQLIRQFQVEDATTNPTLIFQSLGTAETLPVLEKSIMYGNIIKTVLESDRDSSKLLNYTPKEVEDVKKDLQFCANLFKEKTNDDIACELTIDYFMVLMGCEILKTIPGKVSIEVPPQYSFDSESSILKSQHLINLYSRENFDKNRILIKLASTWEGIKAAEYLEGIGIHCNLTLLFSFVQAIAAAQANATLISPFVGRILDWYKAAEPNKDFSGPNHPGIQSVTKIYKYYKQFGYSTIVMAASFRSSIEIMELVGCDKLTIAPTLLKELSQLYVTPKVKLSNTCSEGSFTKVDHLSESDFRWQLNEDRMATEKLSEGIRNFYNDYKKLSVIINEALNPIKLN